MADLSATFVVDLSATFVADLSATFVVDLSAGIVADDTLIMDQGVKDLLTNEFPK
jgi:hypothetical protein